MFDVCLSSVYTDTESFVEYSIRTTTQKEKRVVNVLPFDIEIILMSTAFFMFFNGYFSLVCSKFMLEIIIRLNLPVKVDNNDDLFAYFEQNLTFIYFT